MFSFQFFNDIIYSYVKKSHFATWQFGKIGVLVNFITHKLKSKHSAISVFSGQRFFWGNERKYFPHILGLRQHLKNVLEALQGRNYLCSSKLNTLMYEIHKGVSLSKVVLRVRLLLPSWIGHLGPGETYVRMLYCLFFLHTPPLESRKVESHRQWYNVCLIKICSTDTSKQYLELGNQVSPENVA